jgi:hypothetical protein
MAINLNDADNQSKGVAPPGTYWVKARVKRGGAGEDGLLRLAKNLYLLMLELELTIIDDDEWRGQKIIDYVSCDIQQYDPSDIDTPPIFENQKANLQTAVRIGRSKLKAILNSAFGLMPNDDSDETREKRTLESYAAFDGLCFMIQAEVRPAEGKFRERNVVDFIIEPGDPAYRPRGTAVAARPKPGPKPNSKSGGPVPFDDEIPFNPHL